MRIVGVSAQKSVRALTSAERNIVLNLVVFYGGAGRLE